MDLEIDRRRTGGSEGYRGARRAIALDRRCTGGSEAPLRSVTPVTEDRRRTGGSEENSVQRHDPGPEGTGLLGGAVRFSAIVAREVHERSWVAISRLDDADDDILALWVQ